VTDASDEDLESPEFIRKLKQQDPEAFSRLVRAYQDKIYNLALRLTRNPDEAEEVLQETLLSVYNKIHTFQERSRLSTWIYAITSNGALSRLRKKSSQTVTFEEDALLKSESSWFRNHNVVFEVTDQNDPLILQELQERLEEAIDSLPDGYREIFIMKEINKMPVKEIADVVDINPGAVKTRLHRARLLLRAKLSDFWAGE
jgi:RNA polymerase sigma-70 factor (ECF subfamily)